MASPSRISFHTSVKIGPSRIRLCAKSKPGTTLWIAFRQGMAANEPMILDTCALLWLAAGDKRLYRATAAAMASGLVREIQEHHALIVLTLKGLLPNG
jgi:hypothetical protein